MKVAKRDADSLVLTHYQVWHRLLLAVFIAVGVLELLTAYDMFSNGEPYIERLMGGLFFVVVAGAWMAMTERVTVTCDRSLGVMHYRSKSHLHLKERHEDLSEVEQLALAHPARRGRLIVKFRDGSVLPLTRARYSSEDFSPIGKEANEWLEEGRRNDDGT
ncbi:MAG: hypothetical protein AAFX00_06240 [Pseudomonadota bacterium]